VRGFKKSAAVFQPYFSLLAARLRAAVILLYVLLALFKKYKTNRTKSSLTPLIAAMAKRASDEAASSTQKGKPGFIRLNVGGELFSVGLRNAELPRTQWGLQCSAQHYAATVEAYDQ